MYISHVQYQVWYNLSIRVRFSIIGLIIKNVLACYLGENNEWPMLVYDCMV